MANLSAVTGVVPGLVANYQAASFAAQPGYNYLVSTSAASRTATLPLGSTGAQVQFTDDAATWGVNNLVVAPATGQTIQGLSANDTLTANISGAFLLFSWDSTNSYWVVSGSGFQSAAAATATTPGVVSTTAQTFGGAKTFTTPIAATSLVAASNSTAGTISYQADAIWTPSFMLTSGTGVTFTVLNATYSRLGNVVLLRCYVSMTGTSSTAAYVVGSLPFSAGTSLASRQIMHVPAFLNSGASGQCFIDTASSTANVYLGLSASPYTFPAGAMNIDFSYEIQYTVI